MKFLVFCGRSGLEKFDAMNEPGAGGPVLIGYTGADQGELIRKFRDAPDNTVFAVSHVYARGWRAPPETVVLFDLSWPFDLKSPHSVQAANRVSLFGV